MEKYEVNNSKEQYEKPVMEVEQLDEEAVVFMLGNTSFVPV